MADERLGNTMPYTSGILTVQGSQANSDWDEFDMGENIMTKIYHKPIVISGSSYNNGGSGGSVSRAVMTDATGVDWSEQPWYRYPEEHFNYTPGTYTAYLPYQTAYSYGVCAKGGVDACQDESGNYQAPDSLILGSWANYDWRTGEAYDHSSVQIGEKGILENPFTPVDGQSSPRYLLGVWNQMIDYGRLFINPDTGEAFDSVYQGMQYMVDNGYVVAPMMDYSAIGNTGHPPYLQNDPFPELVPGDTAIIVAMKKIPTFDGVIIRPEEEGGVGINMNNTKIINLAPGTDGTDAVNLNQLNQAIANIQIIDGGTTISQWNLSAVDGTTSVVNEGSTVNLRGDENIVLTQQDNNVTFGLSEHVKLENLTVNGDTHLNNVLVAEGAVVDMGANRITNVAPGVDAGDAVNVSQLKQVEGNLSQQINQIKNDFDGRFERAEKRAEAGVAAAMAVAGLPQAFLPGKSLFAVGGSTFEGQTGFAAGVSRISDNGKWILKGAVSGSSRGHLGANASVGYQW